MGNAYVEYDPEFRLFNREFYDVMADFERRPLSIYIPKDFTKEPKELWSHRHYYTNGEVNAAFNVFLDGYMSARYTWMNY